MPHGPIGTAHTILYGWTLRVMQLFKSLCTGLCFTKIIEITSYLIQIKLIITILMYTRPSLGAIDQMFGP